MLRPGVLCLFCVAVLSASVSVSGDEPIKYSETRRVDHVDDYHGVKVPDPYRWLEDDVRENRDVAAWVEAKNKEA